MEATEDWRDQIARLSQEKRDLQEYAERVTRELRRYQQARPPPDQRPEDNLPLPPWATNMQMMTPLLFAYEERIAELEAVVDRSVSLADQAQVLTRENDALRVELHERTEQLRNLQLMAPARDLAAARLGEAGGDAAEDVQGLYRLSVEQNEALAQQNQLLKIQLEKMQQTLASTQRQAQEIQVKAVEGARVLTAEHERAIRTLTEEKETAEKGFTLEHQQSEKYARQRTAAENRLGVITGEYAEEVRASEHLQDQLNRLQQELQHASLFKRSLEEQAALATGEAERMQDELARTLRNESELRKRLRVVESELVETQHQLVGAKNNEVATQRDAAKIQDLIESMRRQLNDVSARHDRVRSNLTEREQQVKELLSEKDEWATREKALRKSLERLENIVKSETESRQQRCARDADAALSSHRRHLAEAQDQLGKSEQRLLALQARVDVAERKATWESAALERATATCDEERKRLRSDLEEAQEDRFRSDRAADAARQEVARLRADLEVAERGMSDRNVQATAELAVAQQRVLTLERSVSQAREEEHLCAARCRNAGMDHARLQAELTEGRCRAAEAAEAIRERWQSEYRSVQRELQSQQTKARQDEQRAVELLRAQEVMRQRMQDEFAYDRDALQAQIDRLTRENRSLRDKARRVVAAMA